MAALFFDQALLPGGWARDVRLTMAAGRLQAVEAQATPQPGDERHAIGLPGMHNLHSHAFQRGMAGLAEIRGTTTDSFWTWREVMYRFVGRMNPEDIEAVAAQAFVEMLESGFLRVGEFHYIHHDISGAPYGNIAELAERIAAAATATGIGLTLLPVFYAHAGFGGQAPNEGQRRFINDLDGFAKLLDASRRAVAGVPGAVLGVAPHSLRAVTPDQLAAVAMLGDGPIHIHIAEQTREVEDCIAWSGQRPIDWLLDHAAVDRRWCLIHATHATPDEIRRMALSGAVAGLCPVTEASLGDGTFAAPDFIGQGGAFGIGTDSNVLIGLSDELRQLEYSQRLARQIRNAVTSETSPSTGRALFDHALQGGAQALGLAEVGLLAGASADIVALDADNAALVARDGDAILDSLVFAARRSPVDAVWVRGQLLVSDGRHHAAEPIERRFRDKLQRLLRA